MWGRERGRVRKREREGKRQIGLSPFFKYDKMDQELKMLLKLEHSYTVSYEVGFQWLHFIDEGTEKLKKNMTESMLCINQTCIYFLLDIHTELDHISYPVLILIRNTWYSYGPWNAGRSTRVSLPICLLYDNAQDEWCFLIPSCF